MSRSRAGTARRRTCTTPVTTLVAPDGSAFEFTISDGAKQGTLAGGNGVWGADNRCAFGFSRFGALVGIGEPVLAAQPRGQHVGCR